MIKKTWILVIIICNFLSVSMLFSQEISKEASEILETAENFFKYLADKQFQEVWFSLTLKSQDRIANDVYDASKKMGVTYTIEQIKADFNVNGFISRAYWNGFLKNFNPSIVLDECVWEKILHKNNYAEIVIRYKTSETPFNLKLYRENNSWKVGLTETFWTAKNN